MKVIAYNEFYKKDVFSSPWGDYTGKKFYYRSYNDLGLTIFHNSVKIPQDTDIIIGIPRSGIVPAFMIATLQNKPLSTMDSFLAGIIERRGTTRHSGFIPKMDQIRKILIVDDSIQSGKSMSRAKKLICEKINAVGLNIEPIFLAVYYDPASGAQKIADIVLEACP